MRVVYLLLNGCVSMKASVCSKKANVRSGSHLSSLALEATNSLLSPLSSHLGDCNRVWSALCCVADRWIWFK
jgi:hypothetical protein